MVPKKATIQIEMKNRTALTTKHITTFLAQTCWQTALITAGCPRVFIIVISKSAFLMKSAKTVRPDGNISFNGLDITLSYNEDIWIFGRYEKE